MADQLQINLLHLGVEFWNKWRKENDGARIELSEAHLVKANLSGADLTRANLTGADLTGANLIRADLREADLKGADLRRANVTGANLGAADLRDTYFRRANLTNAILRRADLRHAVLKEAQLTGADLSRTDFREANLREADLRRANLNGAYLMAADLTGANLSGSDFSGAYLMAAKFIMTNISDAKFVNCNVYGLSVWDLEGIPEKQENLIITPPGEAQITVDDLDLAQFIYLLLKNVKLKNIIDTITSKAVLILGRFTEERKLVLDAIREELRKQNFTPILFDFDKPTSKDVTGTVETLARMARFIIADLSDPSSIPHELATIIPSLRTTPVLPIRLKGSGGYTMFEDFQKDLPHRVFTTYEYQDTESLISSLPEIVAPANAKAEGLRHRY